MDVYDDEIERLQAALLAAAVSLETIATRAYLDECLDAFMLVRGYAANRAAEARKALNQPPNA